MTRVPLIYLNLGEVTWFLRNSRFICIKKSVLAGGNMNDQLIAVMKAGAARYKLWTSCNCYFSISIHAWYCALCFFRNFRNCFKLQNVCLIKMSMWSYEDPSRFQDAENCIIWNFNLQFVEHDLCPFLHNIGLYLSAPGFITSSNCDFRITAFSLKIQTYKRYTCHVRIQSGLKNDLNTEFWVLNWYYNLKFWTSQKLCVEAPTSGIQRDTEKMGFADHKLCKKTCLNTSMIFVVFLAVDFDWVRRIVGKLQ
jgi:hypothetical protein